MTPQRSSVTDPIERFIAALAERDFTTLSGTLAKAAHMRALLPSGLVELAGADEVGAKFAAWFGAAEEFELVRSGGEAFADRLHFFYRLRTRRRGEFPKLVEQHIICTLGDGRINSFDLVCTGFRPDQSWMMHKPR